MQNNRRELAATITVALLSAIVLLVSPESEPIRLFFTLPLVLFLPGYAILMALLWRNRPGLPEQVVMAIGLSFAVTLTGGLALNWLAGGLQTYSWVLLLTSVTLLGCIVAAIRDRRTPALSPVRMIPRPTLPQSLMMMVAILVAGGAFLVARTGAMVLEPEVTQLWMLPVDGQPAGTMRVGVTSTSLTPARYRIEMQANGVVVHAWPLIVVAPRGSWEEQVTITGQQQGTTAIETRLYREDDPNHIYRQVVWRLK